MPAAPHMALQLLLSVQLPLLTPAHATHSVKHMPHKLILSQAHDIHATAYTNTECSSNARGVGMPLGGTGASSAPEWRNSSSSEEKRRMQPWAKLVSKLGWISLTVLRTKRKQAGSTHSNSCRMWVSISSPSICTQLFDYKCLLVETKLSLGNIYVQGTSWPWYSIHSEVYKRRHMLVKHK